MDFQAIDEARPGPKWQAHFARRWPSYRAWYLSEGQDARPDLAASRAAVRDHMPEWLATYDRLCELVAPDEAAQRYLSAYCPPPLFSGCSVMVAPMRDLSGETVMLRNYDFDPRMFESTVWQGRWSGRHRVIGSAEALMGLLDGVNDAGLAVALTFGGRPVCGPGFGLPLVLRYVLEVCASCQEAVEALTAVPVCYSQNVMVLDRNGAHAVLFLGPDRPPEVRRDALTTNHQLEVEWPEGARYSETVERAERLRGLHDQPGLDLELAVAAFHERPLYRTDYTGGLGTLYTAVYRPARGEVSFRWPYAEAWDQSFDRFTEGARVLRTESVPA